MIVIDEMSSFKNPASKRFKALKKVRYRIKRIVGLTGTPAPNGLMDLWVQVALLDGGMRLGSTLDEYRHRCFWPDRMYRGRVIKWKLRRDVGRVIFDKLKDICMSMKAEDWNRGEIPLLLANPASAGHGLNLQHGGNIIVWFSLIWSLEPYQQADARLHRPGSVGVRNSTPHHCKGYHRRGRNEGKAEEGELLEGEGVMKSELFYFSLSLSVSKLVF